MSIAVGSLLGPRPVRADQISTHADVVCKKGADVALIRFTTAWNEDPPLFRRLPPSFDGGLSAAGPSGRQDCTMANGWNIRVRGGEKQAFAYGMGGADPPAFFSLWIARRKVISRNEWKPGYGNDTDPWLVAVVVRPDRLSYCRVANGVDAPEKGEVTCSNEPLRLDRHEVDRIEYGASGTKLPIGAVVAMPGSPDPKLCREYLRLRRGQLPDSYAMVDSARILREISTRPGFRLAEAVIEVAPGIRRKLISWSGDGHYFDGDLMFLAPVAADPLAVLNPDMFAEPFPTDKLPAGWHLISGQQPGLYPDVSLRYVHFDTQKIGGRFYLLAQPTSREDQPAAILIQPAATGFRAICRFQRIEPNF